MPLFAVIGPDGELDGVENDMHSAVERAGSLAPQVEVDGSSNDDSHLSGFGEFGRLPAQDMPGVAMQNAGLAPIDLEDVMRLSLAEAHSRIVHFFPKEWWNEKAQRTQSVDVWQDKTGMADAMLGQNYKTAKETPEDDPRGPTDVQGLSLLPYFMAKTVSTRKLPMRGLGFCVGSSESCRRTCLVNSGKNVLSVYPHMVKLAKTEALLFEPLAFGRILVEALRKHFHPARGNAGYEPLVRLNVFSDVPWELFFPGIFEMFPTEQFYDYTKVPGRKTPPNYDLTFSWSGDNEEWVHYEIKRQRRIAVVFMVGFKYTGYKKTRTRIALPLPKSFLGLQVKDGDITDVRPRDPVPCVVGLRWKRHGKGKKHDIDPRAEKYTAFVVPVKEVDGVLIADVAASDTPIVDPDETPDGPADRDDEGED